MLIEIGGQRHWALQTPSPSHPSWEVLSRPFYVQLSSWLLLQCPSIISLLSQLLGNRTGAKGAIAEAVDPT